MFRFGFASRSLVTSTAVAACLVGLAFPGAANAASFSFTVNTTTDSHDATPGNGLCADSSGLCSLRAAIEESNALPAGTTVTVTVPAGNYKLKLGALAVTHNTITINGVGPASTIVRQTGSGAVVSAALGANATLTQLKLAGGGSNGTSGSGLTNAGTTELTKVTVTGNAAVSGAGITNKAGATLTLTSSTVSNNLVTQPADSKAAGSGGGILNAGTLTLSSSAVTGNYACGRRLRTQRHRRRRRQWRWHREHRHAHRNRRQDHRQLCRCRRPRRKRGPGQRWQRRRDLLIGGGRSR